MKGVRILTLSFMILMMTACASPADQQAGMRNPEQNSAASTDSESLGNNSVEGNGTLSERIDASILKPSEGLNFESNGDGTCTLIGIGICKDSDVVIPAESPEGEILSSIEKQAFFSLEDVNSVTLLNVSCEVEESAFSYSEITALHIIGGEPVIGQSAFSGCEDLENITFQDSNFLLEKGSFFGIGKDAVVSFSGCTGTIEENAFPYSDLHTLSIADCNLTIVNNAFSSCEDLTGISMLDSRIVVEDSALFGEGDEADVQAVNISLTLEDGAFQYASLNSLSLSGESLEIGASAFFCCEDLATINMDSPAVTIGEYAFYSCEDLVSVSICENDRTDNVISIEDQAFAYCRDLTTAVIGDGTVEIGDEVFSECAKDLTITIAGQSYMNLS